MLFQLKTTITDENYLDFNIFHSLESQKSKMEIRKHHIKFIVCTAILLMGLNLVVGWTTYSAMCTVLIVLFSALYLIYFKKLVARNIQKEINKLKTTGKLPFEPISTNEFYEDKFVEHTETMRMELSYNEVERLCVVGDRFIILYTNSALAHIFPIPQIKEQVNYDEFLRFILLKCKTVENYLQ